MNKSVSLIVPTHNRCYSLKRLLDLVGIQTYPFNLLEVIIVGDGCTDETAVMLKQYNAPYSLLYLEQSGLGAATARNAGAAKARGEILIFLDDDIEPEAGLIKAHVQGHAGLNTVTIGYLPMPMPKKATFHQVSLARYWEQKYSSMADVFYRYNYMDLLSGNFSVSAVLFNKVNKFDPQFRCREDYELGIRLIKAGADFIFLENARGLHRDEFTTLEKSFNRKREEGRADLQFAAKHPDLIHNSSIVSFSRKRRFGAKLLVYFTFNMPSASDNIARSMPALLRYYERKKYRTWYHQLNGKLNRYWYLRGITDALKTEKELEYFIQKTMAAIEVDADKLRVDLNEGLKNSLSHLNQVRPHSISIYLGNHFIGDVLPKPGYEPLKGKHLKPILSNQFHEPLMQALMIEKIINRQFFNDPHGN